MNSSTTAKSAKYNEATSTTAMDATVKSALGSKGKQAVEVKKGGSGKRRMSMVSSSGS